MSNVSATDDRTLTRLLAERVMGYRLRRDLPSYATGWFIEDKLGNYDYFAPLVQEDDCALLRDAAVEQGYKILVEYIPDLGMWQCRLWPPYGHAIYGAHLWNAHSTDFKRAVCEAIAAAFAQEVTP